MATCKHSWKWKEKEYQDGVPNELSVWCERCGDSHELVMVLGPIEGKQDREKRLERFNKEIDRLMEDEIKEAEEWDRQREELRKK
jgi:hypothetical protein